MTIKSMVQLLAQADTDLPDNTTQLIDPADVRVMIKNFIDSVRPGYGALQLVGPVALNLSATPQVLKPYTSIIAATPGWFQVSAANGQATRLINSASLAGATDFIIVSGNVDGPNNDNVTCTLYVNNVATPYTTTVTCQGGGEAVGFNLVAIKYTANSASNDAVYELRVSGTPGAKNFRNVNMVCQSQPVGDYPSGL